MFKELDNEHRGEIDFNNLLNAAVHDYLVASDVRLYEAFRELDENDSGNIKTSDLKRKVREMNVYDNIEMILGIIDDVDLDNDGTIDYQEFLRALHPDFNETPNWFWSDKTMSMQPISDGTDDEASISKSLSSNLEQPIMDEKEQHVVSKQKDGVLKQGWMQKEGKFMKNWKKRWFVLSSKGVVSYYHHEQEAHPIARFNCSELTKMNNKSWSKSNRKRYGIKLYTPHRDWKFLCKNNAEREEWFAAFESVSNLKSTKQSGARKSRSK
eukprot:TRINITY_DN4122_c0_g1_i1.p1 TRINITY_DN4122_c0_g1~~TRINITY_DN4122_c0_g1_i1.p1  ORF type:complete len:268 (-),score=40.15 TRINITY_DN4122_c0_g1_i1:365-1168(-)